MAVHSKYFTQETRSLARLAYVSASRQKSFEAQAQKHKERAVTCEELAQKYKRTKAEALARLADLGIQYGRYNK